MNCKRSTATIKAKEGQKFEFDSNAYDRVIRGIHKHMWMGLPRTVSDADNDG